MTQPLKSAVKQQVQSRQLDAAQLLSLQQLQRKYVGAAPAHGRHTSQWLLLAGAAASVLLAILIFLQPGTMPDRDDLVAEIAAEVVKNHLKLKPLEVQADNLDTVRNYFTELDFRLVDSKYLESIGLELLGGRYCSLQGVTAAQLRFSKVGSDSLHTLYQVGYDPAIFRQLPDIDTGESPVTTWASGIKITLWVEKDLLFALTED